MLIGFQLEEATIFEDRKKIRARLRELRKQKRGEAIACLLRVLIL